MRRFLLACALVLTTSCLHPMPGPTPVVPDVDAGVGVDIFSNVLLDCSLVAEPRPVDKVRTCLDVINTSGCLLDVVKLLSDPTPKESVGCTVRDFSMSLRVEMDKSTAGDAQVQEANAADRWLNEHGIGFFAE